MWLHSKQEVIGSNGNIGIKTLTDEAIDVLKSTLDRYGNFSPVDLSKHANLSIDINVSINNEYQPQSINLDKVKEYYLDCLLGSRARAVEDSWRDYS